MCTRDPPHRRHSPFCGTATAVRALPVCTNSAPWRAVSTARRLYAELSFVGTQLCTPQTNVDATMDNPVIAASGTSPFTALRHSPCLGAYRWRMYVAPVRRWGSCLRVLGTRRQTRTKKKRKNVKGARKEANSHNVPRREKTKLAATVERHTPTFSCTRVAKKTNHSYTAREPSQAHNRTTS